MNTSHPRPISHQSLALFGWLALCFAASIPAIFISKDGWFDGLIKPSWNPPDAIFGPVWTALYIMMAVSAWLVWKNNDQSNPGWPLAFFLLQWLLNALWTPLFFGFHRADLALADIGALWLVLTATLLAFWRVRRAAGILLVPYLAWVSFATLLNFRIWQLNR